MAWATGGAASAEEFEHNHGAGASLMSKAFEGTPEASFFNEEAPPSEPPNTPAEAPTCPVEEPGTKLPGERVKSFVLAGKARFTVVSKKTGTRFTYKVTAKKDGPHFVAVLTGSNNESDYTYLGTIFEGKTYKHGRKSPIGPEAPSAKAFAWFWAMLSKGALPEACEVHHEGRCCRCARALTVPESILSGIGPECAGKMGVAA